VKSYQPLLASPASYEYMDLLNSAVNAARAMKSADAAKLFEASLTKNPYSRDALYNLAVVYLTMEQHDKVAPIVKRLVEVDPANSENYNLAARGYLALSKAARTAKNTAAAAAYNDSTVSWFNRGTKVESEVIFTEFSPSEKQAVFGGTVTDRRDKAESGGAGAPAPARGAKAKAPATKNFAPRPVTVNFEALDATGAVVGKGTATTEPLTPGKSATFKVTIPGANVAGYRYTLGS
jgi:tetratricopeptide (TPR) repeat protein